MLVESRRAGAVAPGPCSPSTTCAERRELAKARREAFVTIPTRRNRVWQTDFFELETSGGGTWRCGDVIDYATKLVLAGPVTATQTHRDAINAAEDARCRVHDLLGHPRRDAASSELVERTLGRYELVNDIGHGDAVYPIAIPESLGQVDLT